MTTYQKTCLICPHCGDHGSACVDHLAGSARFGPWYCAACGGGYSGRLDAQGAWQLTLESGRKVPTLDLLVLQPQTEPVYIARRGFTVVGAPGMVMDYPIDSPEHQDTTRFFYEEYSCPTNWLDDLVMVSFGKDHDPHGLIKFVRRVPRPAAVDADSCQEEDAAVLAAFPEIDEAADALETRP